MLEKSNPSNSHPVVLVPCPSGNACDYHSILSISIFASICFHLYLYGVFKTGEAPPGAPLTRFFSLLYYFPK